MTTGLREQKIFESDFVAPRWLRNGHAQTMLPIMPWAWPSRPALRRETLELPDGDATAVDWLVDADTLPDSAPLLVILHGLEGSANSSYARMLMESAFDRGWRSCVLHFRDCATASFMSSISTHVADSATSLPTVCRDLQISASKARSLVLKL